MATTATFKVDADSGVHRGLEVQAATFWPAVRVKAALLEGLLAQPNGCAADGHHLTLRRGRSGGGWTLTVKCRDPQGRVIHPPTRGALRPVRQ